MRSPILVESVRDRGWIGWPDEKILAESVRERRFVLTHDADFGRLAIAQGKPIYGVLFIRPGDDPPSVVIESMRDILARAVDWTPPLIAVHHRGKLRQPAEVTRGVVRPGNAC